MSGPVDPVDPDAADVIARWPNEALGSSIPWFQDQFRSKGIEIDGGSALSRALCRLSRLKHLLDTGEADHFNTIEAAVESFAEGDGADFLSKTLHRGHLAGLALDHERWRHLVCGNPIPTVAAPSSRERNLTWESVLACAMATFCKDVHFAEPDVVGEFQGREFGIAAKVAYSDKKLWRNVRKGANQADGLSDAAVILVNVVNLLPLADVFRTTLTLPTASKVRDFVVAWADRWCSQPEALSAASEWKETAKNPIGVAFFMPFVVESEKQPLSCYYVNMPVVWREEASPDFEFAREFLHACNSVLGFQASGESSVVTEQPT